MVLKDEVKYALIENNKVSYIFTGKECKEINENQLKVLEIPKEKENQVMIGCDVINDEIQSITLDEAKQSHIEYINNRFNDEVAQLQGEYIPKEEVLTYDLQNMQAQQYLSNHDESQAGFIKILAEQRGVSLDYLAKKIVEKSKAYNEKMGVLIGYRQKLKDSVFNAKSYDEISQISYKSPYGFE